MSVSMEQAVAVLERLKAHYPRLAESDQASKDWLFQITQTPDPEPIAEWMVSEWNRDRAPRIADWVSARRTSVHQARLAAAQDAPMIEPPTRAAPERVKAALSQAVKALSVARLDEAREPLVKHDRGGWSPLRYPDGGGGLAVRPLTYDELYDEHGRLRPEHAQEEPTPPPDGE